MSCHHDRPARAGVLTADGWQVLCRDCRRWVQAASALGVEHGLGTSAHVHPAQSPALRQGLRRGRPTLHALLR